MSTCIFLQQGAMSVGREDFEWYEKSGQTQCLKEDCALWIPFKEDGSCSFRYLCHTGQGSAIHEY